jgi:uncharacterized repeat protein (TIGR03803 family)
MALAVVVVLTTLAPAQTFTTLYNFSFGSDGGAPFAGVVQDAAGSLYGTTGGGGDLNCGGSGNGCGVVYKLDSAGTETVLHSFSGPDGEYPYTPLVRDKAGNIYGTTWGGGSSGNGTVFKIDTGGRETVLHSFTGGSDGCNPLQGLLLGQSGTVFGTTYMCGSSGYGTIFKVDSAGHFTLLHSFAGGSSDGWYPAFGHLTRDKSGSLYGLTEYGGARGDGALYKLSKSGTLTLLYSFRGGSDGCNPYGTVVQDNAGNLYGTTEFCGSNSDYGTVWKVSKEGKETILHRFTGTSDGCYPYAGLARDAKGNLYGVAYGCGAGKSENWGALYELSARGRFTLLYSFGTGSDGVWPVGEVLRTTNGTLFGTTAYGGTYGLYGGTVWSYVP